jgi:hypothetical protein
LTAMLAALENQQKQEAEASCTIQPLPELMRGPKRVAELIMEEQAREGRILNDEQKILFALWVDCLQQAFLRRPNLEEPYLPLDAWLFDIIIDGGGGCGKTMLINYFFVPLCRAFFGPAGVVLAAPSNKAARGVHGKTLHSLLGFTPDSSLRTSALALTTQKRIKLERTFLSAGTVFEDEFSMIAGTMNHAASLLATYARESKFRLRREDYALPRERYGRVPIVGWAGDHLQLPPVPKKNSLFAPLEHTSQEHRVGASIFRNAHYVFQLKQMMRFKDATLLRILHTMRTLGGKALAESDWKALLDTETAEQSCSAEKPTSLRASNKHFREFHSPRSHYRPKPVPCFAAGSKPHEDEETSRVLSFARWYGSSSYHNVGDALGSSRRNGNCFGDTMDTTRRNGSEIHGQCLARY